MKRTIALLLVLCTLFSFAACSSADPANDQPQHTHSFGEWTVTKKATCTEAGEQERVCSCGEKQTQTVAATGHSFGSWVTTKAPTCTETGEQERVCACGEKQTQAVAKTEHSFGEWITTKAPTCTEAGERERVCSCGETQTKTVLATGHSFGTWTTTKEATCTEAGEQEGTCVCGEKQTKVVAATGHSFSSWIVTKASTCTEAGEQERTCSCGEKQTKTINALGHAWKAATCTDPKKCSNCGATEGSALGHIYQNGYCTRCHEKAGATLIFPAAGGSYNYYTDATYQITKIETPVLTYDNTPQTLWYTVKVAIKSTYDKKGNNYSRTAYIGYKIYDEDNVVVKSGQIGGSGIKVGETCYAEMNIYYLEAGHTYTVEFLSIS